MALWNNKGKKEGLNIRKDFLCRINQICNWRIFTKSLTITMWQHGLKTVNNCLNVIIYYYLVTSGGQKSNLYLNAV
jgi:hypothetical protein